MSISHPTREIEYPESDGIPMGETDLHRKWIQYIDDVLCQRYRDQQAYVGSDLLVYYEQGHPTRFVVPDNFVVLNCDPSMRRIFKTWEESRVPDVVFEVSSRSTFGIDESQKLLTYERIGVKEYFLYDPSESYLENSLQGFRSKQRTFEQIPRNPGAENERSLDCLTLGIRLSLDDERLVLTDIQSGQRLLTEAETERKAKETERKAKEEEIASRTAAEARIAELEAEIRALREQGNGPR